MRVVTSCRSRNADFHISDLILNLARESPRRCRGNTTRSAHADGSASPETAFLVTKNAPPGPHEVRAVVSCRSRNAGFHISDLNLARERRAPGVAVKTPREALTLTGLQARKPRFFQKNAPPGLHEVRPTSDAACYSRIDPGPAPGAAEISRKP